MGLNVMTYWYIQFGYDEMFHVEHFAYQALPNRLHAEMPSLGRDSRRVISSG
jgi:hypothetical protein